MPTLKEIAQGGSAPLSTDAKAPTTLANIVGKKVSAPVAPKTPAQRMYETGVPPKEQDAVTPPVRPDMAAYADPVDEAQKAWEQKYPASERFAVRLGTGYVQGVANKNFDRMQKALEAKDTLERWSRGESAPVENITIPREMGLKKHLPKLLQDLGLGTANIDMNAVTFRALPKEEQQKVVAAYTKELDKALGEAEREFSAAESALRKPQITRDGKVVDYEPSPAMRAIQEAYAKGDKKRGRELLVKHLPTVIAETALPSLTQMGPEQLLLPGGGALAARTLSAGSKLATIAGFSAGTAKLSYDVETAASFKDFFAERNVDLGDETQVRAALENPVLVKEARKYARERGTGVAFWDSVGAILATRRLIPPRLMDRLSGKIIGQTAQAAQQMGTGMLGEITASVNAGDNVSELAVIQEGLGELPSAVSEPVIFTLAEKYGGKVQDYTTNEQLLDKYLKGRIERMDELVAAMAEVSADAPDEMEILKLLDAVGIDPEVRRSMENLHSDEQTTVYTQGADERYELNQIPFADKEGNVLKGEDLFSAGTDSRVFWAVSGDATTTSTGARVLDAQTEYEVADTALKLARSRNAPQTEIQLLEAEAETARQNLEQAEKYETLLTEVRPALSRMLEDVVSKFMPKARIAVVENSSNFDTLNPHVLGSAGTIEANGVKTNILHLNVEQLYNHAQEVKQRTGSDFSLEQTVSTLAHETGHIIFKHYAQSLPPQIEEALHAEYRKWLKKTLKGGPSLRDVAESWASYPTQAHRVYPDIEFAGLPPDAQRPLISFNEFLAESVAKSVGAKGSKLTGVLERYIPRLAAIMQAVHKDLTKYTAQAETFEKFLHYLELRSAVDTVEGLKNILSKDELDMPTGAQNRHLQEILTDRQVKIPLDIREELMNGRDRYNAIIRFGATLLQLGWENPHITGLRRYIEGVHSHWIEKSTWNDRAVRTLNEWRKLGKYAEELGRLLLELTQESDRLGRRLTDEEVRELAREKKIDFGKSSEAAWNVYKRVEQDFADVLDELEALEKKRIQLSYVNVPLTMQTKLAESAQMFSALRNRNYFPLSRFGKYGIVVKATKATEINGTVYEEGDTIHFELFESLRNQKRGMSALRRKYGKNVSLQPMEVEEDLQPFVGLPLAIFESLKNNAALGLSEEQQKTLQEMIDKMTPTQSVAKRMLERKGTAGFHLDAQRGYGAYMMQIGGHIARIKHFPVMDQGIDEIRHSIRELSKRGKIHHKRQQILEHVKRHKDYVSKPQNEWQALRGFAFHWMLGFVPKAALVNLTQVPLVALPYLTARKELKKGAGHDAVVAAELVRAMKSARHVFGGQDPRLTQGEKAMLEALQAEGLIDESLASELASVAHGDVITWLLPSDNPLTDKARRGLYRFSQASTFMFQTAEKFNRRIVALAAYRLAKRVGMTQGLAISEAREALRRTQFEYAQWNRPEMMRGKKSVLFVFMQYLQNILYFVTRDPGKWRHMLMLFLVAGIQGLPGAEDLLDLIDFGGTWFKKVTGWGDPYTDSRRALREYIQTLNADPDLIMHGLSAQSMGLSLDAVSDLTGLDIPALSVEGSLSSGRVIPGLEYLLKPTALTAGEQKNAVKDVLGAALQIPISMYQLLNDDDPNQWRKFERVAPNFLKAPSQALRYAVEGEATDYQGKTLAKFDLMNPEHIGELIGRGLGAQITRITKEREKDWATREMLQFYAERRRNLTNLYIWAHKTQDAATLKKVYKEIQKFNKSAPKGQQIMGLGRALSNYYKNLGKANAGAQRRLMDTPAARQMLESFGMGDASK